MEQGSPASDVLVKTSPKTGCLTSERDWRKIHSNGDTHIFKLVI